ncbi:hypothetical protein [Massilia niastensis]|uniref:hypothetical protein n=1 Tax=Massilia niastensis TaxID=544911 RepID=UPI00037CC248|nr:hypothetical protein [Massilia niastensis]
MSAMTQLKHAFPKRTILMVCAIAFVLALPLVAMQFTTGVNWTAFDFFIAGVLLVGIALMVEFALRKLVNPRQRKFTILAIFAALLLIWAELAVGVIGIPGISGS